LGMRTVHDDLLVPLSDLASLLEEN
jgi:hypothetical protein